MQWPVNWIELFLPFSLFARPVEYTAGMPYIQVAYDSICYFAKKKSNFYKQRVHKLWSVSVVLTKDITALLCSAMLDYFCFAWHVCSQQHDLEDNISANQIATECRNPDDTNCLNICFFLIYILSISSCRGGRWKKLSYKLASCQWKAVTTGILCSQLQNI